MAKYMRRIWKTNLVRPGTHKTQVKSSKIPKFINSCRMIVWMSRTPCSTLSLSLSARVRQVENIIMCFAFGSAVSGKYTELRLQFSCFFSLFISFWYILFFVIFFVATCDCLWLKWHSIFYAMRKLKSHHIKKSICFNLQNRLLWLFSGEFCILFYKKEKKKTWNLVFRLHFEKNQRDIKLILFSFGILVCSIVDRMNSE